MNQIDKNYLNTVNRLWNEYILPEKDFSAESNKLRPLIAESWKRSQEYHVSPTSMEDTQIEQTALAETMRRNHDLIHIALPYLEHLYEYMKGTNYLIQLCDKNSCVLKCLSNNDQIEDLMTNLSTRQEGYLVSEEIMGTNSTCLCQRLQIPVQVFGEEHFQSRNHDFTCSSAPIFDDDQNMIGILTLMCLKDLLQQHTLGMVSIAADGIKKELSIKRSYDQLILTNSVLSSTMEYIEDGFILIDENKSISLHNRNVLQILRLPPDSISGTNIYDNIQKDSIPSDLQDLNISTAETELTITNCLGKKADIVLKITTILDDNRKTKASLLTLMAQKQLHRLSNQVTGFHASYTFDSIIGNSSAIKSVINMGAVAAASDSPVLILGESGTGKELVAQSIHNASARAHGPFISLNCGAIPKNLIASELFGSEYGAFTGASKNGSPGKFELAHGGTLFLDEIGDMPFDLQVSLLRVLQSKEVTRLGGKFAKKIDVRIISATNKNLSHSINDNTFRADLYYRLNVLNITIPPLRERPEDIPMLAYSFAKRMSTAMNKQIDSISQDAMTKLLNYPWPGNVRELENTIERAVNVSFSNTIDVDNLPVEITGLTMPYHRQQPLHSYTPESSASDHAAPISPEMGEFSEIKRLLQQERGHVKSVAITLGLPLSTLYSKLKKYNLNPKDYKKW